MLQFYYEILWSRKPFKHERQVPFRSEVEVKKEYKYTYISVNRDYTSIYVYMYM